MFEDAVDHVDGLFVGVTDLNDGFPVGIEIPKTHPTEEVGFDGSGVKGGEGSLSLRDGDEVCRVALEGGGPCADIVRAHADVAFSHQVGGEDFEVTLSEPTVSPGFSALSGCGFAHPAEFCGEDGGAAVDESFNRTILCGVGFHRAGVKVEDAGAVGLCGLEEESTEFEVLFYGELEFTDGVSGGFDLFAFFDVRLERFGAGPDGIDHGVCCGAGSLCFERCRLFGVDLEHATFAFFKEYLSFGRHLQIVRGEVGLCEGAE